MLIKNQNFISNLNLLVLGNLLYDNLLFLLLDFLSFFFSTERSPLLVPFLFTLLPFTPSFGQANKGVTKEGPTFSFFVLERSPCLYPAPKRPPDGGPFGAYFSWDPPRGGPMCGLCATHCIFPFTFLSPSLFSFVHCSERSPFGALLWSSSFSQRFSEAMFFGSSPLPRKVSFRCNLFYCSGAGNSPRNFFDSAGSRQVTSRGTYWPT